MVRLSARLGYFCSKQASVPHAQAPVSVTFYSVGSSGRLTGWVPSSIW